jgi:hypothetical protein
MLLTVDVLPAASCQLPVLHAQPHVSHATCARYVAMIGASIAQCTFLPRARSRGASRFMLALGGILHTKLSCRLQPRSHLPLFLRAASNFQEPHRFACCIIREQSCSISCGRLQNLSLVIPAMGNTGNAQAAITAMALAKLEIASLAPCHWWCMACACGSR